MDEKLVQGNELGHALVLYISALHFPSRWVVSINGVVGWSRTEKITLLTKSNGYCASRDVLDAGLHWKAPRKFRGRKNEQV